MMATMNGNGENGRSLPDGWEWTTINEVADFIRGVTYKKGDTSETPKNGFLPILRATNIQDNKLIINDYLVYVPEKYVKVEQLLKNGDVIVCMSSGSKHLVGKTARLENDWQGSFGTFCGGLRFKTNVNSKFGAYYFQSPYYREFIRKKSSGININNLRFSDFETLEIPLPSLPEQEKIVNRIEELLSDLDAGVASLERVHAGLKRYKASVLKAAVEGKLLEKSSELPEEWRFVKLGSVFQVKIGKTPSRNKPEFWNGDIHWVSSGEVINSRIKETREKITEQGLGNTKLYPIGTVLLAMIGEGKTRGQAAILDIEATTNQNIGAILSNPAEAIPEWVFYWLLSRYEETRKSGVGGMQYALNSERIRNFDIPLPPLAEQRRIVAEVERRLSVVGEVESAVEVGLVRAGRLRQSVLRSAFEGRL